MNAAKYFLIILIPPLIILGNFKLLIFNHSFYRSLHRQTDVYGHFTDPMIVDYATTNIIGFLQNKAALDERFFSNQAIRHLADVKKSVKMATGFFYFTLLAAALTLLTLLFKKDYASIVFSFFTSSIATLLFILALGVGLQKAFDPLFIKFHQITFQNDLWLFPPDDNLIKLLPKEFFVLFAQRLALNILISSLLLVLVSFILRKFAK